MYYKVTPSNGQSQNGLNQPESNETNRVDVYRTPEAARLGQLGQIIEWMRNSAVTTNNFNYDKVKQLSQTDETLVDGINKVVFGGKQDVTISALEMTVMMLHAEAKLGGDFFGGNSKNTTHEFFCSDPEQWSYFESVKKPFKPDQVTMITYKLQGQGIKKMFGKHHGVMTPEETKNILAAAEGYVDYVGRTLYPELYQYYNNWQETQNLNQKTVASQAIEQSSLADSNNFALAA